MEAGASEKGTRQRAAPGSRPVWLRPRKTKKHLEGDRKPPVWSDHQVLGPDICLPGGPRREPRQELDSGIFTSGNV